MKVYRRLLPYVKVYWARIVAAMGLALVISGLEAMTAWLVKPVLDDVFLKKDLFMLKILPIAFIAVYADRIAAGKAIEEHLALPRPTD